MDPVQAVFSPALTGNPSKRPSPTLSIADRLLWWLMSSNDTGMSSKALAAHMIGLERDGYGHPSDGGDLGRCLRLLELIPEWKPRLPEMASRSKGWALLIPHWEDLRREYEANFNVYPEIAAILRGK